MRCKIGWLAWSGIHPHQSVFMNLGPETVGSIALPGLVSSSCAAWLVGESGRKVFVQFGTSILLCVL